MYHRNYTTYLQRELDFLKLLVSRFHEQEKVNGLELDVALQKMQEVYEQLLRIKLLPDDGSNEKKTPSLTTEPIVVKTNIAAPEKIVVAKEEKIAKSESIPVVRQEKKPQADSSKAAILAEKIGPADFHPINETLAQQKTGGDLSSKMQSAPLNSIVSGIGLNDKFLYIRELFKGDNALYDNAIQYLDSTDSLANALEYIQRRFDWDEKNKTAQQFMTLVHRRHGNN